MKRLPDDRPSGVRLRQDDERRDDGALLRAAVGAAVGLEIAGKRARSRAVAERMTKLACDVRAIAEALGAGARRPSTSERLRWEWLASTSSVLDGAPERRLTDEAARQLEAALGGAAHDLAPRLRRAVAECRALVDEPGTWVA